MRIRALGALFVLGLFAACSGIRTYPTAPDGNLVVRGETSGVSAAVHIHRVTQTCQTEYEGTVKLDQGSVAVGIPAERYSYLVFSFSSSSFLRGSSSTSVGTLLKPRPGYRYEARMTYRDDIYDVAIRETAPGRSAGRDLRRRDLGSCGAP